MAIGTIELISGLLRIDLIEMAIELLYRNTLNTWNGLLLSKRRVARLARFTRDREPLSTAGGAFG